MLTTGIEEADKMVGLNMRVVFPYAEQSMRQAESDSQNVSTHSGIKREREEGDDGTQPTDS